MVQLPKDGFGMSRVLTKEEKTTKSFDGPKWLNAQYMFVLKLQYMMRSPYLDLAWQCLGVILKIVASIS